MDSRSRIQQHTRKRSAGQALLRYLLRSGIELPDDYLRNALQLMAQSLMDAEVSRVIAASRYERKSSRRAYRNGYRATIWQTRLGEIAIRIPKLRSGTYTPQFVHHPNSDLLLAELATAAFIEMPSQEQVALQLQRMDVHLANHEIADLVETLFDLVDEAQPLRDATSMMALDQIPILQHEREQELALVIRQTHDGTWELYAHEITPEADEYFWQDFIRRIQPDAPLQVQYINNSRVFHVVQLTDTSVPRMLKAA